jgi:hypothetical protein
MTKKARNRLFALFILAFPVLVLFWFVISESIAPLPPIQALPNPNGCDAFVKAGEMVVSNTWNFDKLNHQELQTFVDNNSNALQLARSGLQIQCRVVLDYSANSQTLLDELAGMKRLAQAFAAEGKLSEMKNHPADAAKSYLDAIHFGNESARGGVLISELVGIAIEAIGTSDLQKIADQLDAKSCHETATALESLDAKRQTWDEVMQQENDWSRRTFTGLRYEIVRLMSQKSLTPALQKTKQKSAAQQLKTRQLIVRLAARAYELDKGKPPANLSELVPDYLKVVPQDPVAGGDIIYSPR